MTRSLSMPAVALLASLLGACASSGPMKTAMPGADLPEAVRVPAGHTLAMETVGIGDITYECREKTTAMGQYEWTFVGPNATLQDRGGKVVGRYFGPPATWAANDGSKITGTQQAVAPAGSGNIPLQLVKANPADGMGAMSGTTYVQRVATRGGVAPAMPCDAMAKGQRQVVQYQADYLFWRAM